MDSACLRLQRVSFVRNRLCCSRLCRSCFQLMQDCGFDQLRPFLYHTEEKPADNVLLFTLLLCLFLEGWVHLLEMPPVWVVSWKRTVVGGIKSCKMACHADSKSGVVHNLTLTLYLMCIAGSQWKLIAFFSHYLSFHYIFVSTWFHSRMVMRGADLSLDREISK